MCEGHPDELVFTAPQGGPIRSAYFHRRPWPKAKRALEGKIPAGLKPHHLRHTCASLVIRRGASVKAVQTQLGHSSPTVTLNVYTHLFGDELDSLWERPVSPQQVPEVSQLDEKRREKVL